MNHDESNKREQPIWIRAHFPSSPAPVETQVPQGAGLTLQRLLGGCGRESSSPQNLSSVLQGADTAWMTGHRACQIQLRRPRNNCSVAIKNGHCCYGFFKKYCTHHAVPSGARLSLCCLGLGTQICLPSVWTRIAEAVMSVVMVK